MAKVLIKTSEGDIKVRLYDETPQHRDNFIKLAKEGYFDGTLFHRVIKDFMIQGGDPESKNAPKGKMLGTGGPDYTIPAEFVYPQLFHKRGALSAARLGDEVNPERESSGSQFYIVWGKTYKMNELKQMEKQMGMQMEQNIFNQLAKEHHDEIMNFRRNRDRQGLMELQDQLVDETKKRCKEEGYPKFTDEQVKTYTEMGGTPFLDNQYTVCLYRQLFIRIIYNNVRNEASSTRKKTKLIITNKSETMMTKTNMMKSVIMLLAIAGSNYSYAQQATVVVSNTTAAQRMELVEVSMADVKAKLSNATPGKGQAYVVKNTRGQQIGSQITHDGKLLSIR